MSDQARQHQGDRDSDWALRESILRVSLQLEAMDARFRETREEMRHEFAAVKKDMVTREEFTATIRGIDQKISPLKALGYGLVAMIATGFFGIVAAAVFHGR